MNTLNIYLLLLLCWLTPASTRRVVKEGNEHNPFRSLSYQKDIACGLRPKHRGFTNRVIDGRDAKPGEFPFQVLLFIYLEGNFKASCSGSIIDEWHILTAAHCVDQCGIKTQVIEAGIGEHSFYNHNDGEIVYDIDDYVVHKNFKPCTGLYDDIALLKVKERMKFKLNSGSGLNSVNSICMPNHNSLAGDSVTISGWGLTNIQTKEFADILQAGEMKILDFDECARIYKRNADRKLNRDKHICLTRANDNSNTCLGDSGSAAAELINDKYHIVGVLSTGDKWCDTSIPKVYTRVLNYLDWIKMAKKKLSRGGQKRREKLVM